MFCIGCIRMITRRPLCEMKIIESVRTWKSEERPFFFFFKLEERRCGLENTAPLHMSTNQKVQRKTQVDRYCRVH